jgi:hypothetical protein
MQDWLRKNKFKQGEAVIARQQKRVLKRLVKIFAKTYDLREILANVFAKIFGI